MSVKLIKQAAQVEGITEQFKHFQENAEIEKQNLKETILSMKQQKKETYDNGYWDASKEFSEKFDMQRELYEALLQKANYMTTQKACAPLELKHTPNQDDATPGQFECVQQL